MRFYRNRIAPRYFPTRHDYAQTLRVKSTFASIPVSAARSTANQLLCARLTCRPRKRKATSSTQK
jgi:hypothetical protein